MYFECTNRICRDEVPRNVYWVVALVQGQLDINKDVQINKLWKNSSHKGLGKYSEEKCLEQRSKVWPAIKNNIPDNFIGKDKHQERIGQREAEKYLGKSYYHHIKYFAANSLAALMWRWYLNSNIQPYNYPQRLQEGIDGIRIKTNNLIYTWKAEMKQNRVI